VNNGNGEQEVNACIAMAQAHFQRCKNACPAGDEDDEE
jgi:hypothetical protein